MKIIVTSAIALLTLAGCTTTEPVIGSINGKEKFVGELVSNTSGIENIHMVTDKNINCNGTAKTSDSGVTAQGNFKCDDGREGDIKYIKNNFGGKGFGQTSKGDKLEFIYGDPDEKLITNYPARPSFCSQFYNSWTLGGTCF